MLLGDNGSFWLGGINLGNVGNDPSYYWMGYDRSVNFTDWLPGQPDNYGNHENCLEILTAQNYKWNDNTCTTLGNFVCEEDYSVYTIPI